MTPRPLLLVAPLLVVSVAPLPSTSARFLTLVRPLAAQTPTAATPVAGRGRITGRVIDAKSGVGLTDVGVQITGTTTGTLTGVDGRYLLQNLAAGTVSITVRRLGYQPKTISGVIVRGGQATQQDVALGTATVQLQAVQTTASAERGSVSAALDQQRTATGIVNAITAEQITRSPDSDAAAAVSRVSGVTVQDGRYVFVRGLGERYTTTSLNGARLPSPEPERKVVPLDLFPSGLLQSITTSKTFTPDLNGDFSGAQVDIRTREFPAQRQFTFGLTGGVNAAATASTLPYAGRGGGELLASANAERFLPPIARAAGDLSSVSQGDKNNIINSFRDVWRPGTGSTLPNLSANAALGGNDPIFGHRVGYLLSGTYSASQEARVDEVRAIARQGDASAGQENLTINRFEGSSGRNSVLIGGLANFGTLLGTRTRLQFNNTYNRTADNDARIERGVFEDFGAPLEVQRMDYVQRSLYSSQLAGEHDLGRQGLDWSVNVAGVSRDQPDRSEFVTEQRGAQNLWVFNLPEGAVRTFAALDERSTEGKLNYKLLVGPSASQTTIRAGGLYRDTRRDSDVRAFGVFANTLDDATRLLPPEQLFGGRLTGEADAVLSVRSLAQGGSYRAADDLTAGFVMGDVPLGRRFGGDLRFIGGARVERSNVTVDAVSTIGDPTQAVRRFTDVLPSLALNWKPSEMVNVRTSVTRTLARPEYRELAGIRTREVLGGIDTRGNPDLVRTLIDNYDLRWEWYPTAGEILSVGVFGKRFQDPIERVFRPSNTNSLVEFQNARSATNYGVEFEARKGLGFLVQALTPITAFANVTLMRSRIQLDPAQATAQNADRAMTGQAPYVINSGLTYTSRSGATSATALFNRVGARINAAGELPLPDVFEQPRNMLDLSFRFPTGVRNVSMRVDARNLLDARYQLTQGNVLREGYRTGRIAQVGFAWRP